MKTRGQDIYGRPADAVDKRKRNHIYNVAEYYLMVNHIENVFCRIDVMEVFVYGMKIQINYLKNCVFEKTYRKNFIYNQEKDDYEVLNKE